MDDYIKREDVVRRIAVLMASEAESDGCEDRPMDNYIEYASEDLADIPSADVAPVRHGWWESFEDVFMDTCYECSECGLAFYLADGGTPQENQYHYCPNCGAKMDEGDTDEIDRR